MLGKDNLISNLDILANCAKGWPSKWGKVNECNSVLVQGGAMEVRGLCEQRVPWRTDGAGRGWGTGPEWGPEAEAIKRGQWQN